MKAQSDPEAVHTTGADDQPAGNVLRLVPREQRERQAVPAARFVGASTANQTIHPSELDGGDDDDPGPAAA